MPSLSCTTTMLVLVVAVLWDHTHAHPVAEKQVQSTNCPLRSCVQPAHCKKLIPSRDSCGCPICALDCATVKCADSPNTCRVPVRRGECCPRCPGCPPDKPLVFCLENPCTVATCPAFPNAECVPDYCGGYNAKFFHKGMDVTSLCDKINATSHITGQVYRECGTACPPTCDNPGPIFCTRQCVSGCQCPPGTLLDEQAGMCVNNITECFSTCPIEGQEFTQCGTACPPTCADPDPVFCTRRHVPGCQCPNGMLLDEMAGKCVNDTSECSCPPTCTKEFCMTEGNEDALCNIPGQLEIPGCFGQCTVTSCKACYYSTKTRPLPDCGDCGGPVDITNPEHVYCLKCWAQCVCDKDISTYGEPSPFCITEEKFKCYRYPCPLKG